MFPNVLPIVDLSGADLSIDSLFAFWCEQAPERNIGKIYGLVLSDAGEMMAKKLFFSPLWHISDSAYMLDISRPNPSRIVQSFQHCIKSRNEEAEEEDIKEKAKTRQNGSHELS